MTRSAPNVLRAWLFVLLGMVAWGRLRAQSTTPAVAAPGSDLSVRLLTIGQGDEVWERFGHNALWIRDTTSGLDVAFNWGTFDFNAPNFLGRFLAGTNDYILVGNDASANIQKYIAENRSIWVQELNLTPAQRLALLQFVEWNVRPENRAYRYDYYRDNCSTRVRDALDRVLGGALGRAMREKRTGTSYRSHTRRLTDGDPLVYTGIQLALGRPADRELDAWDESFLPVRLMEHVRAVRVDGPDGPTALVASERQLFAARRPAELASTPNHVLAYLTGGLTLGAILWVLANAARRGQRGAAALFGVLAGLWTLLAGLAGVALLLAGTVTRHVFMGRNLNLAAFSPLALLLLGTLVVALGARQVATRARWTARASNVAALLLALSTIGWVVALTVGQRSGELFALALPVHLALWTGLRTLSRPVDARA